jgi:site-specific recombinase XerD
MAGHSNVQTTEGYTHLTGKNLLEKMRRMEKNREA